MLGLVRVVHFVSESELNSVMRIFSDVHRNRLPAAVHEFDDARASIIRRTGRS